MKKKYIIVTGIILGLLLSTFLVIDFVMSKRIFPPEGLPESYFDLVDNVEDKNLDIYLYGDDLDFPDSLDVQVVSNFLGITIDEDTVLIINASWQERSLQNINLEKIKELNSQGLIIIFSGFNDYQKLNEAGFFSFNFGFDDFTSTVLLEPAAYQNGPSMVIGPASTDNRKLYDALQCLTYL